MAVNAPTTIREDFPRLGQFLIRDEEVVVSHEVIPGLWSMPGCFE
jgi:hypothetical protein